MTKELKVTPTPEDHPIEQEAGEAMREGVERRQDPRANSERHQQNADQARPVDTSIKNGEDMVVHKTPRPDQVPRPSRPSSTERA